MRSIEVWSEGPGLDNNAKTPVSFTTMTPPIQIHRDGRNWGPYAPEEVDRLIAEGHFEGLDLAWHDGLSAWKPLESFPRFSAQFHTPQSVAPPPPPEAGSGPRLLCGPPRESAPLERGRVKARGTWRAWIFLLGLVLFLLSVVLFFGPFSSFKAVAWTFCGGLILMKLARIGSGGGGGFWGSGCGGSCGGGCGGGD